MRIAAAVETQPQRLTAGITHLQRRQPIAVEIAGLRFVAGQRLRLQRGLRLPAARQVRQRTSGKEQGVGFLGRQPALAIGLFRQRAQQLSLHLRQQLILFQQRQLQGVIAQRATVIAQPTILILARGGNRQLQGGVAARRIAHGFQRNAELQQRQAGSRLVVTAPDFTQGAERRFLLTRQHQRGIGLGGKAAGLGVVAVAHGHQAWLLQIAQQALVAFINGVDRYAIALLAGTHEEVHGVGGQPVLFRPLSIP